MLFSLDNILSLNRSWNPDPDRQRKASAKDAENAKNADNIRRLTNKERKQADSCATKPVEER